jgi:Avidin family
MSTPNIDGSWENTLGSKMVLSTTGLEITGTYSTAVGDKQAKKPLPLKGTLHYPLVSFLVDYSKSDSLCAWVGRFHEVKVKNDDDTTELVLGTLWLLGNLYHGEDNNLKATEFWNTFQINQDVFRRIP